MAGVAARVFDEEFLVVILARIEFAGRGYLRRYRPTKLAGLLPHFAFTASAVCFCASLV
jgi:hypothetical protein